jgi:Zn-dependent protease with chaperone function
MVISVVVFSFIPAAVAKDRNQAAEVKILQRLVAASPDAVEPWKRATAALDQNRKAEAETGFRQVLRLAPDFPDALRRLSYVVPTAKEALSLARRATKIDDSPYNAAALIQALLSRSRDKRVDSTTARTHINEATGLVTRLLEQLPDEPSSYGLAASVAMRADDRDLLRRAVAGLQRLEPEAMVTHYLAGISAALDERWETAEEEINLARKLGLPAEQADRLLQQAGIHTKARNWRLLRTTGYVAIAWALGLILLLLAGMLLSRMTLSTVKRSSPEATSEPTSGMRLIRRIYAVVLGFTSVYFYLSIPVVILLVVAAGGGVIYGFVALGRIPIKLTALIVIGMLFTIWVMIKSLFIRHKDEDPGERLTEDRAPGLFAMLREVADRVGTRAVDAVYLVPDATVAVMERGSFLRRLRGQSQRCLILGLGVLEGMSQAQLKAILAHEYGHFSNKDTAGGDVALHVRTTILASARGMAEGGAAAWYNPAWLFLNSFHRIYLRVSQGASRLQEVLADRWAAVSYGARAFAEGLRHVIRRSVEFDLLANREVEQAVAEARPVRNLYELSPATNPEPPSDADGPIDIQQQIETAFAEAMQEAGSAYDSHPPAQQRIAWVERLAGTPRIVDDGAMVWELLGESTELKEQMTRVVNDNVQLALAYEAAAQQAAVAQAH